MLNAIKFGFKVTLLLFVLFGILIVGGQLIGLLTANGQLMNQVVDTLSPIAFILSAIAAVLGFVLNYLKEGKGQVDVQ